VEAALDRIGAAILPELEKLSAHRDPLVRQRSLSVLAKAGSSQVGPLLLKALEDDRRTVREAAMMAAANYIKRQGSGAKPLAVAVSAKLVAKRWQERKAAAEALGSFGALADEDALTRTLAQDPKAFVRQAAAVALGQLASKKAIGALMKAAVVSTEPNAAVRLAAIRALGKIGDGRAKGTLVHAAEHDPSPAVREAAKRFY
jgi:HEAT repeat protein